MLKKIRLILAVACFALITLLFLDFTGTLHQWFGWLAKIQLIPAILAANVVVIVVLALLTFIFGRVYCSVICPLGILQDGISHVSGKRKGKKNRFRYSKAKLWLRYGFLVLFVVALIAGIGALVSLLDPYAAYGRIASNFFAPVYRLGNNLLAWFAERIDSYAFYTTEVWVKSWITFGVAAATLITVGILAWRNGRTYCNTVCPVGTMLGFISRFSIFRTAFDTEKCTQCGRCEKSCKASCIDSKNLTIDHSRCVTCFNCIEKCNFNAIKYAPPKPVKKNEKRISTLFSTPESPVQDFKEMQINVNPMQEIGSSFQRQPVSETVSNGKRISRLGFLSIAGVFAFAHTVRAQQLKADGGLADLKDKKVPDRKTPLMPPGATGLKNMNRHCTACQLCVSVCPNNILKPSGKLSIFMQPEMTFERGYCRPECTECSQVCPSGAISPITAADKSAISIGHAVWIRENCVVVADELPCTACERHCPTKAITLIELNPNANANQNNPPWGFRPPALKIPVVNKELCIGCGACEYLCPARPFSAIYVEGNVIHHSV